MKRKTVLAALLLAAAAPLNAQQPVRTDPVECSDWGDRRESWCEEREYVIPARASLDVDAGTNGGISVVGWDRDEIRLVARVRAHANHEDDARALAREVSIGTDGVIEADGPRMRNRDDAWWGVSFELHVPRGTQLRLDAMNGGIDLEGLTGSVDAQTTNGGISVVGGAGRIRGETTNGGIDLELTGSRWEGAGVDLRSTNGGVTILVPDGYSAELETGTTNGGMDLDFPVTVQGRITRSIRTSLGEGGPLIRVMTTNGGVALERT